MSTTELTPQQKFEDKLRERLRADIGDLIPDEVLKELVDKTIQKGFFEQRRDGKGSWFEEEVRKLLQSRIQEIIQRYMKDNRDAIATKATEIIVANGPRMLGNVLVSMFSGSAYSISTEVTRKVVDDLRNEGRLRW